MSSEDEKALDLREAFLGIVDEFERADSIADDEMRVALQRLGGSHE